MSDRVEPLKITAGFDYTWDISGDYSADDGWTLKYQGVNSDAVIEIIASGDGYNHTVEILAVATAEFTKGNYQFSKYFENEDGRKILLETLKIEVLQNPITDTPFDTRSHAEIMLEAIEALEQGRASVVQSSFTIAGRAIQYLSPKELIEWKNHYKTLVRAERGQRSTVRRLVEFKNP